jgi:hypothetical protein
LDRWRTQPRLRRCSPITLFLAEAAEQALACRPDIDRSRVGVVGVFFIGCLAYTIRFFREYTKQGRRFASPILFPETVFNSPLSHVVSTLKLGGPVYSQVGDKSAWVSGLRTADIWLRTGAADHVLVLGAEEFDPMEVEALRVARWATPVGGILPGEGGGGVLVSRDAVPGCARLTAVRDGYAYHGRRQVRAAAASCLEGTTGAVLPTAGRGWMAPTERDWLAASGRATADLPVLPCEAYSASAAWETIRAARRVAAGDDNSLVVPVWGFSSQISALQVGPG